MNYNLFIIVLNKNDNIIPYLFSNLFYCLIFVIIIILKFDNKIYVILDIIFI